jgi:hypothetical protein
MGHERPFALQQNSEPFCPIIKAMILYAAGTGAVAVAIDIDEQALAPATPDVGSVLGSLELW